MSTSKLRKSELFGNYFKTAMKKCFNVDMKISETNTKLTHLSKEAEVTVKNQMEISELDNNIAEIRRSEDGLNTIMKRQRKG